MPARYLAGLLGLLAFAVCMIGGLVAGTRAATAIERGLWAMILFALLGWCLGWAAEAVIHEYVRKDMASESEESATQAPAESQGTQSADKA